MTTPSVRDQARLRPVSPVDAPPLSPTPSEAAASDSEAEADQEARAAKRRKIELIAQQYLTGQRVFILSAGLRGPFDENWKNPWGREEKGRLPERNAGGKTSRNPAVAARKKRKTNGKQGDRATKHSQPAEREEAEQGGGRGTQPGPAVSCGDLGVSTQQSQGEPTIQQGNERPAVTPERIFRGNPKATPPTDSWLRRATTPRKSRNRSLDCGKPTVLTSEAQTAPETPISGAALSLLQAPEPAEASRSTGILGSSTCVGFTPLDKSNKPTSHIGAVHLPAKPSGVDGNGRISKKRPRHLDFAAMSSPSGPKLADNLNFAPKLNSSAKGLNTTEKSNAKRPAWMPVSGREHTSTTASALTALRADYQQREDPVADANGQLETLGASAVTPTVVPSVSWTPNGGNAIPNTLSNRRGSLENQSTQAEMLNAQRLFRAEIPSPGMRPPLPPELTLENALVGAETGGAAIPGNTDELSLAPPFRSFNGPPHQDNVNAGDNAGSPGTVIVNTQELMDAMSPFSFSTVKKKPTGGIFAKRASLVQTPSRSSQVPLIPDVGDGALRDHGLDMVRPLKTEESTARPQQCATGIARQERTSPNLPTSPPGMAAGSLAALISPNAVTNGTRKNNPNNDDSEEELSNYIDEISNYLEVWDIEAELKRVATTGPSSAPAVSATGILSTEGRGQK